MNKLEHYKLLSKLFLYPTDGYKENVRELRSYLLVEYPQTVVSFDRFADHIDSLDIHEIEELFGVTFHIQAICYLDLGYVLFAEDFKRGEFLVHMKNEQRKINHDCGEELPDNLAHVLFLISESQDTEFINELVVKMLVPALNRMLGEFSQQKLEAKLNKIKNKEKVLIREDLMFGNVYKNALQMLVDVLEADFGHIEYKNTEAPLELSTEFLSGCGSCTITTPNTN